MSAPYFNHHIFFCTNQRPDGHERGCCAVGDAAKLRDYMKAALKEKGIPATRVNNAGCLDRCECGPVMVIYPEGTWYFYESKEDIDEIIENHLLGGKIIDRLLLRNDQKTRQARQKSCA